MMTTALYRHFANDGSLLYVGVSLSWPERTKQHRAGSRWFDEVARLEIEHFPTRDDALAAEREAIKAEKPKFNVIHNKPAVKAEPVQAQSRKPMNDPLLNGIAGPDAIVGPALIYRGDLVSIMVAHGVSGTAGQLTEVELGELVGDIPDALFNAADSVMSIRKANEITMAEAQKLRAEIVRKLRKHLSVVETFNTDLGLAIAYASRFPSKKSEAILRDIAGERP